MVTAGLVQTPWKLLGFHWTKDRFWPDFTDIKHDYIQEFYRSYSSFISQCLRTAVSAGAMDVSTRASVATVLSDNAPMRFQLFRILKGKTSYRKISWSLEAARFGSKLFQSLWNLAGTSAALLPRCLSNFRAIRPSQHPISRLRDFTRFGGKASYRLVNRGPALCECTFMLLSHNAFIAVSCAVKPVFPI